MKEPEQTNRFAERREAGFVLRFRTYFMTNWLGSFQLAGSPVSLSGSTAESKGTRHECQEDSTLVDFVDFGDYIPTYVTKARAVQRGRLKVLA